MYLDLNLPIVIIWSEILLSDREDCCDSTEMGDSGNSWFRLTTLGA